MKKIIVLNHKSYLNHEKAKKYPLEINNYLRMDQTIIICPSSPYFLYYKGKYNFKLGSQSISDKNITGELTGELLKSLEVDYVLVNANDKTNEQEPNPKQINNRIKEAINNGIKPIITIGETYYEQELNKTADIIVKQLKDYLKDIEVKQDIIINYYPNYSYKGKQTPKEKNIYEVVDFIKNYMKRKYNVNTKVIYGGNVTIDNIEKLEQITNIDGYIIEESSINIKEIVDILNKMK